MYHRSLLAIGFSDNTDVFFCEYKRRSMSLLLRWSAVVSGDWWGMSNNKKIAGRIANLC
jgi:hypothetical protein